MSNISVCLWRAGHEDPSVPNLLRWLGKARVNRWSTKRIGPGQCLRGDARPRRTESNIAIALLSLTPLTQFRPGF